MVKQIIKPAAVLVLIVLALTACKKTYFNVAEEARDNASLRFTTQKSYFEMGKSIALTSGGFALIPGDSLVLFVEGRSKYSDIGEEGVASLAVTQTARFYVALPPLPKPGKYNIRHGSICEILGSLRYDPGATLFTCQSGRVVIDSIVKDEFYGSFEGEYLNTSNQRLTVDGAFKAGRK